MRRQWNVQHCHKATPYISTGNQNGVTFHQRLQPNLNSKLHDPMSTTHFFSGKNVWPRKNPFRLGYKEYSRWEHRPSSSSLGWFSQLCINTTNHCCTWIRSSLKGHWWAIFIMTNCYLPEWNWVQFTSLMGLSCSWNLEEIQARIWGAIMTDIV